MDYGFKYLFFIKPKGLKRTNACEKKATDEVVNARLRNAKNRNKLNDIVFDFNKDKKK